MIQNLYQITHNIPEPYFSRRKLLLKITDATLRSIHPNNLLKKALTKTSLSRFRRILVIGIGKSAKTMADAVQPILRKKTKILFADTGHPLPTPEGVEKTAAIIREAGTLEENDLAIVLVSGGGSSMFTAPAQDVTLTDKIKTTKSLLLSGATIQEINVVRKHLSAIKGGQLAYLLSPATVWAFVMSDVPGNNLSAIASGPLSPDPSTFADALKILRKYRIKAPSRVMRRFELGARKKLPETPKRGHSCFHKVRINIIADHNTAVMTAKKAARKLDLAVHVQKRLLTGEARKTAKQFVQSCRRLTARRKRPILCIAAGETTVTCRGAGTGGRNQEFALSGLQYLSARQTLLSIGTDGIDGMCPEKIAGAIVDAKTRERAKLSGIKANDYLKRNDSYHFFKRIGGQIKTGPTGTNLGDLILLLTTDIL